jgi:hypothetical protein
MKLAQHMFKSDAPADPEHRCHFGDKAAIQTSLSEVCDVWVAYLQDYVDRTESLFGHPELPWENTERAIVSTLSTAIARGFKKSSVIEEHRVTKFGKHGRCDLWASIPECVCAGSPFSFYLEAKKSVTPKSTGTLKEYLKGHYGISKLFRDYLKSHSNRIAKLSAYSKIPKGRKHDHYVIGLLITQLEAGQEYDQSIDEALIAVFQKWLRVRLKPNRAGESSDRSRRMGRFPTVALTLIPDDPKSTGMIASFTVFGATRQLLAKTNH